MKCKQRCSSVSPFICGASLYSLAALLSFILQMLTSLFPFYVLQHLISTRGSFGVTHDSLLLFPPSSPCCHPMRQPPPDNDVLIMRLLGQQIALQSHSHAVENCCCLGAPTLLCVSARLTLASCWEQCSSTRAGALSLSV